MAPHGGPANSPGFGAEHRERWEIGCFAVSRKHPRRNRLDETRDVQKQTVAIADAVGRTIVPRFLPHIDNRPIARKLRQATDWIAVADIWRIVANQITNDANIKCFG